jgi:hypothetical protein
MDKIKHEFAKMPEQSEWKCYLFGSRPPSPSLVYIPSKGREPNWFVRGMMRVCFDCLWVKEKNQ